ncbi:site-specific DNA-methyltransferase [Sphingomonas asaccharolytica]|uniref:site-specific DNA-methyltransferase n=1 Tax=Sphingomonas asaccharolytica TaxID=40681 RepID=UPI00083288F9|nr:DNA methyltransferase [Sphingomonas asaccharolytica]
MVRLGTRQIEERAVALLKPRKNNPRTHSPAQLKQIEASIQKFGFVNPVLVDEGDRVLAGHGRLAAAKSLGMQSVPVVRIEGMTEADRKAYVIADNRLAELAGWDQQLLKLELGSIIELDPAFDLALTGFADAELEGLLAAIDAAERPSADEIPEPAIDGASVSAPGQLWTLGRHRLICGDARDPAVYARLLGGERAGMVITDPPYNVPISGHVCGLGKVQHREFAMASGEMSGAEFEGFLKEVLQNLSDASVDGSIHYVFMDWRHIREVMAAGDAVYDELKNLIVWNKDNGGMGTFYRSKHELVFAFKKGTSPHVNNFKLGQHGRYRTNVWDYAGVNSLKAERDEELAMHPTVKPVAMIADAIRDCSKRGGIVLDAFSGSGTTIMAAEETGRRACAVEIDPRYVDVAIRRWQTTTGGKAILDGIGCTFQDVETALD